MDAMVVQLESLKQSSFEFEQYGPGSGPGPGPWHYRDLPPHAPHALHSQSDGVELGEVIFQSQQAIPGGLKTGPCLPKTVSKPPRSIQQPKGPSGPSSAKVAQSLPAEGRSTAASPMDAGPAVDSISTSTPTSSPVMTLKRDASSVLGDDTAAASSTKRFSFDRAICPVEGGFSFPLQPVVPAPRLAFKRCRPLSDVDGRNTASLGCKKRRLRRDLITSRLSQPFSLPATHILNRESAVGDKRFLKLAAIMSARRMSGLSAHHTHHTHHHHPPSPSSLLRRAAVINRFRLRVINRAAERGDDKVADLAGNAALLQQSHGLGLVVGARFPVAPPSAAALPSPSAGGGGGGSPGGAQPPPVVRLPIPMPGPNLPHPLSKAAVEAAAARLSPPTSPRALKPMDPNQQHQPGGGGGGFKKLPPSPRLRPIRSSEEMRNTFTSTTPHLQQLQLHDVGDLDDDDESVAFPTSEHESRYESSDDPDDVYADFGVIFGGGGGGSLDSDDEGSTADEEHYEDYMDDLDGIPWEAR